MKTKIGVLIIAVCIVLGVVLCTAGVEKKVVKVPKGVEQTAYEVTKGTYSPTQTVWVWTWKRAWTGSISQIAGLGLAVGGSLLTGICLCISRNKKRSS